MSIEIRTGKREDAQAISGLSRETFYASFAAQNTAEDMDLYLSTHFLPEQILAEFDEPNARFLLAYVDGVLAGYSKMSSKYHPKGLTGRKPIEIERLYVLHQFHGQKIGWRLMQACFDYARELQREVLWLGVWKENHHAIRFYEKAGFSIFGEHEFRLGNDVQQDWLMMQEL